MRAGRLRHVITIEQSTKTDNTLGEPIETWATFKQVRAQITPINGKEYFAASQIQSTVSHKVKIRYTSGITTDMRINFNGRYFDIESIINFQERNKEIEMMVTESV